MRVGVRPLMCHYGGMRLLCRVSFLAVMDPLKQARVRREMRKNEKEGEKGEINHERCCSRAWVRQYGGDGEP